ncbi:hypothetical protein SK128_000687 [Halocaridina rubra]|uniref:Uncharacterized protein n=1 Tax=Halocaridina rubra TaxID=373956 RepID=A0AAN9AF92_HALRR
MTQTVHFSFMLNSIVTRYQRSPKMKVFFSFCKEFLILCYIPWAVCALQVTEYVRTLETPHGISDYIDLHASSRIECARNCNRNAQCQGFVMLIDQDFPCKILVGFLGTKSAPAPYVEAYVTTTYNGVQHVFKNGYFSWNTALAFCQSLGMTLVSYPDTEEKKNWLKALSKNRVFIGVQKSATVPTDVYDINTNALVTVAWAAGYPTTSNKLGIGLTKDGFDDFTQHYVFSTKLLTALCQPTT